MKKMIITLDWEIYNDERSIEENESLCYRVLKCVFVQTDGADNPTPVATEYIDFYSKHKALEYFGKAIDKIKAIPGMKKVWNEETPKAHWTTYELE